MNKFSVLPIKKDLLQNLEKLQFTQMTAIQKESLPLSLQGNDIIAKAKTGSGKTIAFGLVMLNKLQVKKFRIQSMVLCPTRELANQVADQLRDLAKAFHNVKITTLCGGMPYKPQVHSLSHQAHIIVGTPGRILKHLQEDSFDPNNIDTLVLDEADRMLDMGFSEDVNAIIDFLPQQRQTLLFSATMSDEIITLSQSITTQAKEIFIEQNFEEENIKQFYYYVPIEKKTEATVDVIKTHQAKSTIIFCNTKIACEQLADDLDDAGVDTLVLHSDYDQNERNETLILFASKTYPIMIATDVAARGLDIDKVDLVINYDEALSEEIHTHRIGRTGRFDQKGIAVTFCDDIQETVYEFQDSSYEIDADFRSIYINGGKKQKVRSGDILGAFTADIGLHKEDVGKIDILPYCSYVAIKSSLIEEVYNKLQRTKIKGKFFKTYLK